MIALVKPTMDVVGEIDDNLARIEANERENLALVLRNGRLLSDTKNGLKHGEWLPFLSQTRYANKAREAQKHMQIWRRWEGRIARLMQAGVLAPINPELDWVNRLSAGQVNIALSVVYALTPDNIPDSALDIALAVLEQDGHLESPQLPDIVEAAEMVDNLPPGKTSDAVRELVTKHGVTNPDVVRLLPQLAQEKPNLVKEWTETGAVYIQASNDGDGEQIPLRRASVTDVRLALGDNDLHVALRQQEEREKWQRDHGYVRVGDPVVGTRLEIVAHLMELFANSRDNDIFRAVLFRHTDQPETDT